MREFAKSGIAATGASLGGQGFDKVKTVVGIALNGTNSLMYLAGEALASWFEIAPNPADIRNGSFEISYTAPTALDFEKPVNTATSLHVVGPKDKGKGLYIKYHSQLKADLTNIGSDLEIYTPPVVIGYDRPTIGKGVFYLLKYADMNENNKTEIIGINNNAIISTVTGGKKVAQGAGPNQTFQRGCMGSGLHTWQASGNAAGAVEVYEICIGYPEVEYWGAIQPYSTSLTAASTLLGFLRTSTGTGEQPKKGFIIDKKVYETGVNVCEFYPAFSSSPPPSSVISDSVLRGDIRFGRFTGIGMHPANNESGGQCGMLLYEK